jgi:hypothetical protein
VNVEKHPQTGKIGRTQWTSAPFWCGSSLTTQTSLPIMLAILGCFLRKKELIEHLNHKAHHDVASPVFSYHQILWLPPYFPFF